MSELTQHEVALMSRTSWLMEQIVKTEIELVKYSTGKSTICHQFNDALYTVDGIDYKISLNIMQYDKPVPKADDLNETSNQADGSFGT